MNGPIQLQRGFTLIEVLVALLLLSMVSLISWRGLDAVQRVGERLDVRADQTLALLRVLAQMERDVLLHGGSDVVPGAVGDTSLLPSGIQWTPRDGLQVVRSAGSGQWQLIRWYLVDGQLFRAHGLVSSSLPLPPAGAGAPVLGALDRFSLRAWRQGQGWVSPAAGPNAVGAPSGIEIQLEQGKGTVYRKVVLLP